MPAAKPQSVNTLKLSPNATVGTYDALLQDSSKFSKRLIVSHNLKESGTLGVSLAMTQFILTWIRHSENKTIEIYCEEGDTVLYRNIVERVHGLAAVYFADSVISYYEGKNNLRYQILSEANERITAMHLGNLRQTAKGPNIELVFIENAAKEFHPAVYRAIPSHIERFRSDLHGKYVRSPSEMTGFFRECFRTLRIKDQLFAALQTDILPLGEIVTELFRNTAEHAYKNPDGSRLQKNLRCIKVSRTLTDASRLSDFELSTSDATANLTNYFNAEIERLPEFSDRKLQFLEISIFDSGPGFAATISAQLGGERLNPKQAVVRCFQKSSTAKHVASAGLGLGRVLKAVDELRGFVRFRTGITEALYAAGPSFSPEMDPCLFVHGKLPEIEGTLVTIGLPLDQ